MELDLLSDSDENVCEVNYEFERTLIVESELVRHLIEQQNILSLLNLSLYLINVRL